MIENLVGMGVKPGDKFVVIGAITGKRHESEVTAVTLSDYHDNNGKVTMTNVVTRNLEHGSKAVFSLAALQEKKAAYIN